jgi:hypothetical protein
MGAYLPVREGCPRCHGEGYIPEYKHIDDGICFRCRNVSASDIKSHAHFNELADAHKKRHDKLFDSD